MYYSKRIMLKEVFWSQKFIMKVCSIKLENWNSALKPLFKCTHVRMFHTKCFKYIHSKTTLQLYYKSRTLDRIQTLCFKPMPIWIDKTAFLGFYDSENWRYSCCFFIWSHKKRLWGNSGKYQISMLVGLIFTFTCLTYLSRHLFHLIWF